MSEQVQDKDRVIDRIRKLLQHARASGERHSEQEAMNYLAKARELMAEHDVAEYELFVRGSEGQREALYSQIVTIETWTKVAKFAPPEVVNLAHVAVELCGVRATVRKMSREKYPGKGVGKFRDAYMLGLTSRLAERAVSLAEPGAIVSCKSDLLDRWFAEQNIGVAEERHVKTNAAYKAGRRDGNSVPLRKEMQ